MSRRRLGLWMYRWHARAGLITGLFLTFICVTGSVAVFKPEIEACCDWGAPPVSADGRAPIGPEQAVATALAAHPGARANSVWLPAHPGASQSHGDTYRVNLSLPRASEKPRAISVLVDPYANTVVAEHSGTPFWSNVVRQTHARFFYGSYWGRWLVGLLGIALTFAVVSGAWIYLRFNANRWRPMLRRGRGARVLLADLHKLFGIGALAFNLLFGVTGAVLGLEGLYLKFFPAAKVAAIERQPLRELPAGTLDRALQRARESVPGASPTSISLGHPAHGTLKILMEVPTASLVREGESSVTLDARSLEPLAVVDARQAGAVARAHWLVEPLHFGRLGGSMAVKLIWAAMGLSGAFLSISGFAIYLLRKRRRTVGE